MLSSGLEFGSFKSVLNEIAARCIVCYEHYVNPKLYRSEWLRNQLLMGVEILSSKKIWLQISNLLHSHWTSKTILKNWHIRYLRFHYAPAHNKLFINNFINPQKSNILSTLARIILLLCFLLIFPCHSVMIMSNKIYKKIQGFSFLISNLMTLKWSNDERIKQGLYASYFRLFNSLKYYFISYFFI